MVKNLLELRDIDAYYGTMPVLKRINLAIGEAEVVFVVGANGAGKTTLLKAISGLIKPTRGTITFRGQVISGHRPDDIFKAGIAHVPEGRRLFNSLTVLENLEMGAYTKGKSSEAQVKQDMELIFSYFPILAERKKQLAGHLSGGQQQMLAIARGLISRPLLLLMDEPSLGLAPVLIEYLASLILELRDRFNTTLLLVEQNVALALDVGSRGYIIQGGEIVLEGSKEELYSSRLLRKMFLGHQ